MCVVIVAVAAVTEVPVFVVALVVLTVTRALEVGVSDIDKNSQLLLTVFC